MPSLQVVDLSEDNPEPTGVEGLFSRYRKYAQERKEGEEVQKLTNQYLQNQDKLGAWEKLQFDLMNNQEIGPTKRLETQAQLDQIHTQAMKERETIAKEAKEKKDAEKEAKTLRDEAKKEALKQKESEAILLQAGFSPEESAETSKYISPEGARHMANKKLTKTSPASKILKGTKGQEKRIDEVQEGGLKSSKLLLQAPEYLQAIENLGKKGRGVVSTVFGSIPGGQRIAEAAYNADEQTINSITKQSLLKSGDLAGLRLTDQKLRFLEAASPAPHKTYEANKAAYEIWKKQQELAVKYMEVQNELIRELKDAGAKEYPADFDLQLQERVEQAGLNDELDEIVEKAKKVESEESKVKGNKINKPKEEGKVRVRDKKTGRTGSVTPYEGMEKIYDRI